MSGPCISEICKRSHTVVYAVSVTVYRSFCYCTFPSLTAFPDFTLFVVFEVFPRVIIGLSMLVAEASFELSPLPSSPTAHCLGFPEREALTFPEAP